MKDDNRQPDLFEWADTRSTAEIIDFMERCLYPRLNSPVPFYGQHFDHTEILPLRRRA